MHLNIFIVLLTVHLNIFIVLLTVHLSIFISVFNQVDAQNFCFTISLFHASTCFEHHVLIIRRSKLHYTASGIVTPVGGRLVHGSREDCFDIQVKMKAIFLPGEAEIMISCARVSKCVCGQNRVLSQPVHQTATYRCDDSRGCVMQF